MEAEEQGSVTRWIDAMKGGEDSATEPIWGRYFDRLARLARERLRAVPRTVADEEDIALSAFDSFFVGVERGRFPRLRIAMISGASWSPSPGAKPPTTLNGRIA